MNILIKIKKHPENVCNGILLTLQANIIGRSVELRNLWTVITKLMINDNQVVINYFYL